MTLAEPKNETSAIAGKANTPTMTTVSKTTKPFLMIPSPLKRLRSCFPLFFHKHQRLRVRRAPPATTSSRGLFLPKNPVHWNNIQTEKKTVFCKH
jgi:hypothetical protein